MTRRIGSTVFKVNIFTKEGGSETMEDKILRLIRREGIDVMRAIMGEEKKSDLDKVTFTSDTLRKYFPKSYTPARMQETIIKLLEQWQKKRQRDQER
ncbi:hypothetical protein D7Y09_17210 [bacterium 1XD42-1]|nr:hypothetical protein D7Y09_17210 [bacterium 1XD42-1]